MSDFGKASLLASVVLLCCFTGHAQIVVFAEDFEGAFPSGWSVGDSNVSGITGYWGKVDLTTFGSPPPRTGSGNYAGYCAGVGYGGSLTSPTYQNSMTAYMSRSISLSAVSTATLSFWYIIPAIEENIISPPYDSLRVTLDGVEIFVRKTRQTTWTQASIDLSAYVGGTHTLTFEFTSDGSIVYEGAYIDDLLLVGNDPNDQIPEAIPLGAMTQTRVVTNAVNSPTDVDMYSFTVTAGQRISFDIDQTSGLDSFVRLFDASGTQLAANDDAPGPVETNSWNSYLEYTFGNSGTFYLGVSGYANTNYNAASGSGDVNGSTGSYTLVVSPGIAGTVRVHGYTTDYLVDLMGQNGKAIDPTKRTWIVIHGRNSSRSTDYITNLAATLATTRTNDQVLTLDWSQAAAFPGDAGFGGEDAIENVAAWAASALVSKGFASRNLNLVGHSWGSSVADEVAERLSGSRVESIIGLDPAEDIPTGYNPNESVWFGLHSLFSWAFYSSAPDDNPLGWFGGNSGNEETPRTAHEAFTVANTSHNDVVWMFAWMLLNPFDPIGSYFALDRLLAATSGPWQPDQYSYDGLPLSGGGYEGMIDASNAGRTGGTMTYIQSGVTRTIHAQPALSIQRVANTVILTWPASYVGFTLQQKSSLTTPAWAFVSDTPMVQNGTNFVILDTTQPKQFFRLVKP